MINNINYKYMNKYFYDDIFISIELGRQSAWTGRATSYSNGHIWNWCLFSCSTSSSHGYVTVIINSNIGKLLKCRGFVLSYWLIITNYLSLIY